MGFVQGSNAFAAGKIKLGSTDIDRLYFGSDLIWPFNQPDPPPVFTGTGVLTWESNTFTLAVANVNLVRQQVLQADGIGGDANKRFRCSDDYKNIIIGSFVNNEIPYISNNYGASFYQTTGLPAVLISESVCMSKSGKYIYIPAGNFPVTLYRSSNFGLSFQQITGQFPDTGSYFLASNIAMSHSGKEVLLCIRNQNINEKLYLSTDYGENFLDITNRIYPSGNAPTGAFEGCFVSGDGLLIGTLSGRNDETNKISTDFGQTWQEAAFVLRVDWGSIESSYTGRFSLLENQGSLSIANSSSLGTVYSLFGASIITFSISNSGERAISYTNLNGSLKWYNSTDDLGSWQQITPSHNTNFGWIFN